ncbi:hypothetical protein KNE206_22760 [Kitasatospora sp. NE20-6]|uniref:acyltransferase family protein n=1 Tax=Kitasatospora sp. NE20-6 TaxID=2859066 RepID=UPI0034DB8C9E
MSVTEQQKTEATAPPSADAAAARPAGRLGWLDALRGVAAMVVPLHHFGVLKLVPHGAYIERHFDLGIYAVMLFFLVSGYIVPASLERRGDVRGFWIGRIFRIYPLVAVTVLASLLLPDDYAALNHTVVEHPVRSALANGLLLQEMLHVPNAIGAMWTLCYEMVFYFLVAALFVVNLHRRSASIATGFAAAALLLGAAVSPTILISVDRASTRNLIAVAVVVVVASLAAILSGRTAAVRAGSLVLGLLGLVLALGNARSTFFETMMIFATMFAGTVIHRMEKGQLGRLPGLLCCGFVLTSGVLVGYLYNHGAALDRTWTHHWAGFSLPYLAAWISFGVGMLLRHRAFPRVLTWLGAISYSVYIVHIPLMFVVWWALKGYHPAQHGVEKFVPALVFVATVLVVSHLTYRLVELPGQNLGRRLTKAVNRRSAAGARPATEPQAGPAAP